MDRDRDRDLKRGLPGHSALITPVESPSAGAPELSKKQLLLDQSELGDAARQRLLQRDAGALELGVELRALRDRGAQLDKLPVEAQLKERDRAVVEILAASFSLQAYADVSSGRANSWEGLRPSEKLQLLRLAEVRVALFEDVDPSDVLAFLSTKFVGRFDSNRNELQFHEKKVLEVATEEQAILLLVHEQTHRTQFEAIKHPDKYPYFSPALIDEWRENWDNYKDPGDTEESKERYASQPLETYADERSEHIVGEMYDYRNRY